MKNFLFRYKRRILIFLAVLGPSTITTMAGNDAAGVITYSISGAHLGYAILFILPFLTLLYATTQEVGSRVAVVTGKGLGDLIRERFGVRISVVIFSLLLLANFGTILTNVAALKTASGMLGLPTVPFIIAMITASFLLVAFSDYQRSQKIFLTGIVLYFSYIFSAVKSNPNWGEAFSSMIIPSPVFFTHDYIVTSIAVLGTTITPWGQFFVQSYMKDKKLNVDTLKFSRLEAYFGSIISNFFTFFIIVATAATLFIHKIPLTSGEQAALAIQPFAGEFASILFGVGLVSAAVIGMIIVSLSSAYVFTEFFGFEGTLDAPYQKGKAFYSLFLITIVIAALVVFHPSITAFKTAVYTQSLNAILLPVIFYFLLKIANDEEYMGKFTNGKWTNYIAITSSFVIVLAAFAALIISFIY